MWTSFQSLYDMQFNFLYKKKFALFIRGQNYTAYIWTSSHCLYMLHTKQLIFGQNYSVYICTISNIYNWNSLHSLCMYEFKMFMCGRGNFLI